MNRVVICMILAASLPVRGAWIEIHVNHVELDDDSSLPVRGAWIEMPMTRR